MIASRWPTREVLPVALGFRAAVGPRLVRGLPPIAPLAAPLARNDREWLQAKLNARVPSKSRAKVRKLNAALWAAAGFAFFAGGVATLWQLWSPSSDGANARKVQSDKDLASLSLRNVPHAPAPAMKQPTTEMVPDIAPASDSKPTVMAPPNVVALNVSTAPGLLRPLAVNSSVPPAAGPAEPDTEVMRALRKVVPTGGPLTRPGEAIVKFLAAATWQERLKYTLGAEKIRPLMESYYRSGKDGAVIPQEVELLGLEPTEDNPKFHCYSYILHLPGRPVGIPLSVEDTTEGPRVEWRTFVECKDNLLAAFYEKYVPVPRTFRVLIRRCHYFKEDVPDQKFRQCFEIMPPDATETFNGWVVLGSDVCKKHFGKGERSGWEVTSMMTLTLEWQKADNGAAWVEVRNVEAGSWHPELLPAVASY